MRSKPSSQNTSISGTTGGGASPADSNTPTIINNPKLSNKINGVGTMHLYLTNIRSIQQQKNYALIQETIIELISKRKKELRGKQFQIKDLPPNFCKYYKLALLNCINGKIVKAKFTRIGCKPWTCPYCCTAKALKVKYMLRDIIQLNNLGYFLTLTLDPKKIPPEYSADTHRYITMLFNHFLTILKRHKSNKSSEPLKYVWVIEFQKNGNAHLHILLNKFLPITVIRNLWVHVGGGHIMRVEKIKSLVGISNYVSDYIVKGIKGDLERPSGFRYFQRRYSISKSCIRTTAKKKQLFPFLSLKERYYIFKQLNLQWVYNTLYELAEKDIIINFEENKT